MTKCESCKFEKQINNRIECYYCMWNPDIVQRIEFGGFEDYYEPTSEILNTSENPEPW